jgi:hypothetical protein
MLKHRLAPLALSLVIAGGAQAASLTPPNLVAASSLNNPDLLLVWPYAAGGPLEAMSWSVFKAQMASGLTGSFLAPSNNLSDLGNPTVARTNLGLGSAALINTGTSGAALCLLNTACSYSASVAAPAYVANGTAGAGYIELDTQSPFPSAPGSLNVRVFADGAGRLSWVGSAGFKSGLDASTITSNRNYSFPDTSGAVCVQGANCGTTVSGAIKGNGSGTYSQAACADLSDGGNGGCASTMASTTWTPILTTDSSVGNLSVAYSVQNGKAAKFSIGGTISVCYASFNLRTSTFTWSTTTGFLVVTGLPYGSAGNTLGTFSFWSGFTGLNSPMTPNISSSKMYFNYGTNAFNQATFASNTTSGTNILMGASFWYDC